MKVGSRIGGANPATSVPFALRMRRIGAPSPQQRFYQMDPTNQRSWSFYKSGRFLCWAMGPLFVFALFGWACWAFSYLYCYRTLWDQSSLGALELLVFNGFMFMACLSLLRTTICDPGAVPPNFQDVRTFQPCFVSCDLELCILTR